MAATITVLDSVPLFPTPSITILAGALFGFQYGLAAVLLGQIGATAFCFLIGRYVLSDMNLFQNEDGKDDSTLKRVLDELTSGLNSNDFKTVFLTILVARQSPILPFSLGNYFVGTATTASLFPILLATAVGVLPLDILYVGAGAGGSVVLEKMQEGGALAEGVQAAGVLATLALVAYTGKTVYKVIQEDKGNE